MEHFKALAELIRRAIHTVIKMLNNLFSTSEGHKLLNKAAFIWAKNEKNQCDGVRGDDKFFLFQMQFSPFRYVCLLCLMKL